MLRVTYQNGEPSSIKTTGQYSEDYRFAVEGRTARLVDVRARETVEEGESCLRVGDLSKAHDEVLALPFIDTVTVWMKGRTESTTEDGKGSEQANEQSLPAGTNRSEGED